MLRYAGDAVFAEFSSVVACVNAAVIVQTELTNRNRDVPEERQVLIRIGVNLGEVLQDRGEIYGAGVNVAARLESLAPPGGVCITEQVAEQIAGKLDAQFESTGRHKLKNIAKSTEVWCWPAADARKLRRTTTRRRWAIPLGAASAIVVALVVFYVFVYQDDKPSAPTGSRIAVIPFENLGGNPDDAYFSDA